MRKSWILLLAGLLLVALFSLTGCSKTDKNSTTAGNAGSNESKPAASEKANNETKLTDIMKNTQTIKGVSYEMKSTMTSSQGTMNTAMKTWVSGAKARMETESMGVKTVTIVTAAGDIYLYTPASNTAMKLPSNKNEVATAWAQKDLAKYKILGEEKISGQDCLVITSTDIPGDNKTWISEDIGMPLKSEMKTADGTVTSEFSNIKLGPQADDLFVLPAGAQIVDMPQMPGQ